MLSPLLYLLISFYLLLSASVSKPFSGSSRVYIILVLIQSLRPTQPGQPSRRLVGEMSTSDGRDHCLRRNDEFCVTVGSGPALLA